MAGEFKNQHWIPKCYTKAWCDNVNGQSVVHRYSPDGIYLDYRPPKRLFSSPDLYTITSEDGTRDLRAEHALQRLENEYSRVRRRLQQGLALSIEDRAKLTVFVSAMRNRSPLARDHWADFLSRIEAKGDAMMRSISKTSPEKRAATIRSLSTGDRGSISLDEIKTLKKRGFGSWLPVHITTEAKLLAELSLLILETEHPVGFLTSDRPVVWWDTSGMGPDRWLALGNLDIEVSMPISPKLCAIFYHGERDLRGKVGGDVVDDINGRTTSHASDYIISGCPTLVFGAASPSQKA